MTTKHLPRRPVLGPRGDRAVGTTGEPHSFGQACKIVFGVARCAQFISRERTPGCEQGRDEGDHGRDRGRDRSRRCEHTAYPPARPGEPLASLLSSLACISGDRARSERAKRTSLSGDERMLESPLQVGAASGRRLGAVEELTPRLSPALGRAGACAARS